MFRIYQLLSYILLPVILLNLYLRILNNKEDKKRYRERLGINNNKFELTKKIIWLHAASIGEFKSSDIIIKKYHKNFHILVTTTTKTSAEYVKQYYNDKVIHQYIPFDIPLWCSRFIKFWNPCLVLWIESDIWPNMLRIIKDSKINCFYINARVSPTSFSKWKYIKSLYSISLNTFDKIFAQSPNDLMRIEILTNNKIEYIGNLKLSKNQNKYIQDNTKKIFSIMIVSTHESEEEKIINKIENIIKTKKLKLCIAPRHPERVNKIESLLRKLNLNFTLDSENKNFENDVTIIDSFGNLDSYFNKSEVVILGGSFVSKGGHNPLEPAKYGCAIISGKLIYNWQNIYDEMIKEKACIVVNDLNDLKNKLNELLLDKNLLDDFKKKALDFSNKKFFDKDALFNEINLVLK